MQTLRELLYSNFYFSIYSFLSTLDGAFNSAQNLRPYVGVERLALLPQILSNRPDESVVCRQFIRKKLGRHFSSRTSRPSVRDICKSLKLRSIFYRGGKNSFGIFSVDFFFFLIFSLLQRIIFLIDFFLYACVYPIRWKRNRERDGKEITINLWLFFPLYIVIVFRNGFFEAKTFCSFKWRKKKFC